MKENKCIEKELLFKNNIKEITSISLDSEYKIDKKNISGNFLISGDYKIHEVSINRENFTYKIPFKHELDNDIEEESVKLEITNFEYDYKKDELMVKIEYDILGDRKDVLIFEDEESLEDFLTKREIEVIDTRVEEINEYLNNEENIENKIDEVDNVEALRNKEEIIELSKNIEKDNEEFEKTLNIDIKPINKEVIEEREIIKTNEIINNVGTIEDSYVTYKVYTINPNETLESLVIKHKTTIDELKEYNDLSNLNINDKIIIPYYE